MKAAAAAFWPELWQRFSLLAMVSLGVIILSGGWLTWVHVGSLSQMVTTQYGLVLTAKILVVFGAINQLHLIPAINRARAHSQTDSVLALGLGTCRKTVLLEAVLGLVPFLSGSARKQAAADAGKGTVDAAFGPAVFDGSILAMAVAGLAVMALLFWGSAKAAYRRSAT
ncbi:CopD family protein [Pseudarthrobacter sp. P1]|uniref:CopD family protein n=1 Tax=Pseudarthrobacter sp. P1 TaxID=3418418 RepID=UPI003CF53D81